MKKFRVLCFLMIFCIVSSCSFAFAHSGGLDSNGGHHDYNNKSGLGYYHYHCWGYPPHLHPGGVCPYRTTNNSSSSWTSGVTAGIAASSKIQLKRPVATVNGYHDYIKVSWGKVNHAEKYCVYRATSKNGNYNKISTVTGTSYKDYTAKAGKRYYYKVKAFGSGRYTKSYYSKIVSSKRTAPAPKITTDCDSIEISYGETKTAYVYVKDYDGDIIANWWADWIEIEFGDNWKSGDSLVYEVIITCNDNHWIGEVDSLSFSTEDDEDNYIASIDIFHE